MADARGWKMRRLTLVLAVLVVATLPSAAAAAHSLRVTTTPTAFLLSASTVQVSGTLTCVGAAESGTVGVVLIQPPGGVALTGGGSTPFSCYPGETVFWYVNVHADGLSSFALGEARFDTFAATGCSDDEADCPSAGVDGLVEIKATPSCFGQSATIVGSAGGNRIEGTPGADVIVGRGGHDILFGGEGDDLTCGNGGNDWLDGGEGHDRMSGAAGRDNATGWGGNDEIWGGAGDDVLGGSDSEDGDDLVLGGPGDDDLSEGRGVDRMLGGAGNDVLWLVEVDFGTVVDLFSGGPGWDRCFPEAGDRLLGCERVIL